MNLMTSTALLLRLVEIVLASAGICTAVHVPKVPQQRVRLGFAIWQGQGR